MEPSPCWRPATAALCVVDNGPWGFEGLLPMRSGRLTWSPIVVALMLVPLRGEPAPAEQFGARPQAFVDAADVVDGLVVEMRYFGTNNFVGAAIDGYEAPRCLLTAQAAQALAAVQRDLRARGLGLKVYDCYRPLRAVAHFRRWARDTADVKQKREFYPDVDKRNLFALGYLSTRSSHARGSTVDLTLVNRRDGTDIDMDSPFDFFGTRSHLRAAGIGASQSRNRLLLAETMGRHGFRASSTEWWHFTLANEPFPAKSFDFPVR
jgi:zinc D-Ala-D-Ala dipeptidase